MRSRRPGSAAPSARSCGGTCCTPGPTMRPTRAAAVARSRSSGSDPWLPRHPDGQLAREALAVQLAAGSDRVTVDLTGDLACRAHADLAAGHPRHRLVRPAVAGQDPRDDPQPREEPARV